MSSEHWLELEIEARLRSVREDAAAAERAKAQGKAA